MIISPLAAGSSAPAPAMAPPNRGQIPTQENWLSAAAAEELTFQFSANVEAEKKREEEHLEKMVGKAENDVSVQQVTSILRLMEGNEVFDRIRMQANVFAHAFSKNPEGSSHLLSLDAFEPSQRYTAMLLTLDALEKSGHTAAAALLRKQNNELAQSTNSSSLLQQLTAGTKKKAAAASSDSQFQVSVNDGFYSLISAKPSLDSVLDTANQLNSEGDFEKTLDQMQMSLSSSMSQNQLMHIGSTVIVCRLIGVVRTMIAFTEEMLAQVGIRDLRNVPATLKHTQSLIKLAASAAPSSLLDKLASTVLGSPRRCPNCRNKSLLHCTQCERKFADCLCPINAKPCTCPDAKAFFFSLLYQKILLWPDAMWATPEGNKVLREQLVRKQRATNDIYRVLSR